MPRSWFDDLIPGQQSQPAVTGGGAGARIMGRGWFDDVVSGGDSGGAWEDVSPILQRRRRDDGSYEYRSKPHDYAPSTGDDLEAGPGRDPSIELGLGRDDIEDPGFWRHKAAAVAEAAGGPIVGLLESVRDINRANPAATAALSTVNPAFSGLATVAQSTPEGSRAAIRDTFEDIRERRLATDPDPGLSGRAAEDLVSEFAANLIPVSPSTKIGQAAVGALGRVAPRAAAGVGGRIAAGAAPGILEGGIVGYGASYGTDEEERVKATLLGAGLGGGLGALGGIYTPGRVPDKYNPSISYVVDDVDPIADIRYDYDGRPIAGTRQQSTNSNSEFNHLRGMKYFTAGLDPDYRWYNQPEVRTGDRLIHTEGGDQTIYVELKPDNPLVLKGSEIGSSGYAPSPSRLVVDRVYPGFADRYLLAKTQSDRYSMLVKEGIPDAEARDISSAFSGGLAIDRLAGDWARSRGYDAIVVTSDNPTAKTNVVQLYPSIGVTRMPSPGQQRVESAYRSIDGDIETAGTAGTEASGSLDVLHELNNQYTQRKMQVEADIDNALSSAEFAGRSPTPEESIAFRNAQMKRFELDWHKNLAGHATRSTDSRIHDMADRTEQAAIQDVQAPPKTPDPNESYVPHTGVPDNFRSYVESRGLDPDNLRSSEVTKLRRDYRIARHPDEAKFLHPFMDRDAIVRRRGEEGFIQLPGLGARKTPKPVDPMSAVIAYGDIPREPVRVRLRKAADRWVDTLSDKDDAAIRVLRRAGLGEEARTIAKFIGRRRGASRIAKLPIFRGVYMFDPVTKNTTRTYDSYSSIVSGLDGQAERDLNNLMAARHHMELLARRDRAQLEYDVNRARRLEEMRQARLEDKASLSRMSGDVRSARVRELQAERQQARAAGRYGAFLTSENRARGFTSRRSLLSPAEQSTDLAAGAVGRGNQAVDAAPDPRKSIAAAQRVAMSIRDDATNFRRRFPVVQAHPDTRIAIHDEGTRLAQEVIADLEKRYGTTIDPTTGRATINTLEPLASRVREWSTAAVIDQLDSIGYFKPGQRDSILSANEEYAPMFRLLDDIADDERIQSVTGGTSSHPIRNISGGLNPDRKIVPPLESFVAQAQRIGLWIERQRVKNILGDFVEAFPDELGAEIKRVAPNTDRRGISGTFTVFRGGERVEYAAKSDVLGALDHMTPPQANIFMQAAVFAARTLRAGATLTLDFAIRNFLRDQVSAGVYGAGFDKGAGAGNGKRFGYRPFSDFAVGLWAQTPLANHGLKDFVTDWEASGGALSDYISIERPMPELTADSAAGLLKLGRGDNARKVQVGKFAARTVAEFKAESNIFAKVMFPIMRPLEGMSGAVEQATRIGEFRRMKLQGANDLDAGFASRNVTLDFGRSGSLAQRWNSVEAFANASLQDVARFSQAMKTKPVATTLHAFALITLPSLAAWAANKDDPDYESLPEWEKAAFIHLDKRDDGTWWRLPRPQGMLNLVFGYGPQKMLEMARGTYDEPVTALLQTIFQETPLRFSPVQPDPGPGGDIAGSLEALPSLAQPAVEALAGEQGFSSHQQRPIVPQGLMDQLPENRYADTTSATARKIGQLVSASPLKIDHLIRGYGAGMGVTALRGAERLLGANDPDKLELPTTAKDIPGVGGLISSSSWGFASAPVQDLYALQMAAANAAHDAKEALDRGNWSDYQRITREHPEYVVAKDLTKARRELKELRDYRNEIKNDQSMTPEQRMDALIQNSHMATQIAAGYMHDASNTLRGQRRP